MLEIDLSTVSEQTKVNIKNFQKKLKNFYYNTRNEIKNKD